MEMESARATILRDYRSEEYDHFGKVAYRITPKKTGGKPGRTFMTLWLE